MRETLAAVMILAAALPAGAEPLAGYRWEKRPILVFAPGADDPRLAAQLDRFEEGRALLDERKNIVIVDTDDGSPLRQRFRPEGFTVILVGLDGGEKLRSPEPVPVSELTELIDTMPMRQREMREDG